MFEIKETNLGEYYFEFKALNNQVLLTSDHYYSKSATINGIEGVKRNAGDYSKFEKFEWWFRLKAGNGQVLGRSNKYQSETARDNNIEVIMKYVDNAKILGL